jgi:WD40 repeat protein
MMMWWKLLPSARMEQYVVSEGGHTARVWEAATGFRMAHDNVVKTVAFSPDERYVVSGSWDGTARVWKVATGEEIARMTHDSDVHLVAFSRMDNLLYREAGMVLYIFGRFA